LTDADPGRLRIDLLESPELIPARSDGIPIPGNEGLSSTERDARIAALFLPYHQAIAQWLEAHPDPKLRLISVHSFNPTLAGQSRPWPVGSAYGRDPRLARQLRPALLRLVGRLVGDNEPYGIEDEHDFTLPTHGERRGIPHVMIEIRQDELHAPPQIAGWVERLARACSSMGAPT
jgi:predicted N-formylglutamate amidohydrolase